MKTKMTSFSGTTDAYNGYVACKFGLIAQN